jgi:hypothetical protein
MRGSVSITDNVGMQIAANSIGYIRIYIRKNIECSNLVFKPMVRNGSIVDDTFEPYQIPTDERIIALEARVAALEAIINNR